MKIRSHFFTIFSFFGFFLCSQAFAGQGAFVHVKLFDKTTHMEIMDAQCLDHTHEFSQNGPELKAYWEGRSSGICLFQKSYAKIGIFNQKNQLISSSLIHISVSGSSLEKRDGPAYQEKTVTAQIFPHRGNDSQDQIYISASHPVDHWQKDNASLLHSVPLNHSIIPGTHDSGTVGVTTDSVATVDSTFSDFLVKIGKPVMVNWAKTQDMSFYDSLQHGIRYFDLRLCGEDQDHNKIEPVLCHSLSGTKVSNLVSEVDQFLREKDHGKEIIILDFNHIYGIDANQFATLKKTLWDHFSDKIATPDRFSPTSTYADLWESGKQIIVIQDNSFQNDQPDDLFWQGRNIDFPWAHSAADEDSLDTKISKFVAETDSFLNSRTGAKNTFFGVTSQVTPDEKIIVDGLLNGNAPNSISGMVNVSKHKIDDFYGSEKTKKALAEKGNIITEDKSNGIDLVNAALDIMKSRG